MADDTLPLNLGSGGRNEDIESLTGAGGANVIRQRLQVAGAALAEIARVINTKPVGTEYALTIRSADPDIGTWGYNAGVSGTLNIVAGRRVTHIAAHSTIGGSMTVNGGDTITIPANSSVDLAPGGNVTAPTIVFTGTDAFFVEWVS